MTLVRLDIGEYAEWLKNRPETPLWQSLAWKSYQEALGRETRLYGLISDSPRSPNLQTSKPLNLLVVALVIIDRTAFGLSTWDIPRGPLGENPQKIEELLEGIIEEAKKERCMAITYSPLQTSKPLNHQTSKPSSRHEQPEASVVLDVRMSEEELLAKMKEKGRYNIRVAAKHGVSVSESQDIDAFYSLLQKTSERDRYGIKPKSHYQKFLDIHGSFLLLAYAPKEIQNKSEARNPKPETVPLPLSDFDIRISDLSPIAGLLGVLWGETGIYYYGASDHRERAKMAPYALQFEAMKLCKARGATHYDLFGIDPPPIDTGTGDAMNRASEASSGSWAGVTRFKKQFGGEVVMYPKEREIILMKTAKKLIGWKRKMVG